MSVMALHRPSHARFRVLTAVTFVLLTVIIVMNRFEASTIQRMRERFQGTNEGYQLIPIQELKGYLVPPCEVACYNLDSPNQTHFSQFQEQREVLEELFSDEVHRYFVEAGAFDGETYSNTLWLERQQDWTGLLIEPSPAAYAKLEQKRRKSWLAPMCLSPTTNQAYLHFLEDVEAPELSKLAENATAKRPATSDDQPRIYSGLDAAEDQKRETRMVKALCVPLGDLLYALGWTRIDLLSLDAEGIDLDILKTFPWSTIDVKVVIVEKGNPPTPKRILNFMTSQGYNLYKELNVDYVFTKEAKRSYKYYDIPFETSLK